MNRRDFLKLLGVSSTAAVLTPATVLAGIPEKKQPELLVTEYVLSRRGPGLSLIEGLVLPAPASTFCRARILLPADGGSEIAVLRGVASGNGPGEVILDGVRNSGGINVIVGGHPLDVSIFSPDFVAVDWPVIRREPAIALEIDYTAFADHDETFYLGLAYQSFGDDTCTPFPNEDINHA